MFMPKLLLAPGQKGWPMLQQLLVSLFHFLHPYLSAAELSAPVRMLYRGALRVLLVLLHDFPEFLCDYHFAFCDVIPPSCIQMRNLILSAFPRNMRLPDPFTPNLKVDLLPEISQPPRIRSAASAALAASGLQAELDSFLHTRAPYSWLAELHTRLVGSDGAHRAGVINALVLHVGSYAIATITSSAAQQPAGVAHSAPMDIFLQVRHPPRRDLRSYRIGDLESCAILLNLQPVISPQLTSDLNPEGRYVYLNAIANQLRYPNNHTHYFSCVLLYLFSEVRGRSGGMVAARAPSTRPRSTHPSVRAGVERARAGADHPRARRAADRAQAPPVGPADHLHRAHQEPEVPAAPSQTSTARRHPFCRADHWPHARRGRLAQV